MTSSSAAELARAAGRVECGVVSGVAQGVGDSDGGLAVLPKAQAPAFSAGEHYQACKEAPALVNESGLARITLPPAPFAQVHRGAAAPNALQASLMEQLSSVVGEKGPGITVLTDATGAGKTIAALAAPHARPGRPSAPHPAPHAGHRGDHQALPK